MTTRTDKRTTFVEVTGPVFLGYVIGIVSGFSAAVVLVQKGLL